MACASSCPTQDHPNYGACLRAKSIQLDVAVPGLGYDPARNKAWDARLESYREAREQGIQPTSTKSGDIKKAVEVSNQTGTAFQGA